MSSNAQPSEVVIIGGGIIGLSAALRLAREKVRVTVLERGAAGREASWAAAGLMAPCSWSRRDPVSEMLRDAIEAYPQFVAEVAELSGVGAQYIRSGRLHLLYTDQHVRMAHAEVRDMAPYLERFGAPLFEVLTPEQAHEIEPAIAEDPLAVTRCHVTAQVRNPRLLRGLIIACRRLGVELLEGQPVAGLLREGGRVVGVRAGAGEFRAGHTVLAAGSWSALFDEEVHRLAPVYPVRGQIVLLYQTPLPFRHVVERGKCYIVPRNDGHILIGATEEHESGYRAQSTAEGVNSLLSQATALVPVLAEARVVRTWAGLRPGTPDRRPVIGTHEALPGLIFASGHFRTGLILAPVTAEIIRDIVLRGTSDRDLRLCQPGRQFQKNKKK